MQFIPAGGGGDSSSVVWNPGAAASPDYVTTWAAVMTAFAQSSGEFRVSLDSSGGGAFDVPAGTYDLENRLQLSRPAPAEGQLVVNLADGAVFQDLAGVYRNITLRVNPTAAPALELTSGRDIEFDVGSILENAGSYPALEIAAGETVGLLFYRRSRATATSDVIADLTAATAALNATFMDDSQASTNWVSGIAGTTLTYRADASYNAVTLASPPATVTTTRTDTYANMGGSGGSNEYWFSPVDLFPIGTPPTTNAGSFTVSSLFSVTRTVTVTGIRFWKAGGVARTYRVRLRDNAGTSLATVDVATTAAGIYTGTFTAPQVIAPEAGASAAYKACAWETSGTEYTRSSIGSAPVNMPAVPALVSRWCVFRSFIYYAAADANPTTAGTEWYVVEPVVTG